MLTLRDYIRYDERSGALAGALQGLLISHHVLFLGFGMEDPNFLRLHDGVARLLPRTSGTTLGTALMVGEAPASVRVADALLQGIDCFWAGDFAAPGSTSPSIPEQAHALEVFLDELVLWSDTSMTYATDVYLRELLDGDERAIVDELRAIRSRLASGRDRESPVLAALREGLDHLLPRGDGPPD